MKEMGINKVIFDKFNTLVKKGTTLFIDSDIKESYLNAQKIFGKENIFVISNLHPNQIKNINKKGLGRFP